MKTKKIEKELRKIYKAGQDSVSCMRLLNSGKAKFNSFSKGSKKKQTDSAEDEAISFVLQKLNEKL